MRAMLLLLLQMKPTSASQASCFSIRTPLREVRSEVKGEDAIVKGHGPDAGVILAPSEGLAAAEGGADAEFGE
ncbi:hypothetical protein KC320_g181 [Hortaea werneckii]|nr:hypothetical protein KC320_g181 [Hortaea werneckii]